MKKELKLRKTNGQFRKGHPNIWGFKEGHAGWNKGKHGLQSYDSVRGPRHYNWKGGRQHVHHGYVRVLARGHPRANPHSPYVYEHILVWEKAHGRYLPENWSVHHLNGIKDDNRPENLKAMPRKEHGKEGSPMIKALQERIRLLEEELKRKESDENTK